MKSKKKSSMTIKNEIFLLSFLSLAGISIIFSAIFLRILYRENMESAQNMLLESSSKIVTYTEGIFHENASVIDLLSRDEAVIAGGTGEDDDILELYESIHGKNSKITYIYSGYENGKLCISGYDIPEGYDATKRPWYQAAIASDGVERLVYADVTNGEWLFSQCKRLTDEEGNTVGVISIDSANESITNQLSKIYQYDSQRSYIMNRDGVILIHPEEKYINETLFDYMDKEIWADVIKGISSHGEYEKDGVAALAYFEQIPETDLIVATAIDAGEVTAPIIRNIIFLLAFVVGISIVLGLILSRMLIYRFARPIMALKNRISDVAAGTVKEPQNFRTSNAEITGIAESIEIIVKNIAKREEERKAAEYTSFHDSMTGLYNRRFFEEELRRLDTVRNYPLCVICCDVNGLKLVNDLFGHAIGDRLIQRVSQCVASACRNDDIAARMGGDEFSVILPRTSARAAQGVIARIRDGFPREIICEAAVSASLGYAVKTNSGEDIEETIRRADKMMYNQKLLESAKMKSQTVGHIIKAAESDGLICQLTGEEENVLRYLADELCPDDYELLRQSYWLRKIGLCTVFMADGANEADTRRHTENGYRVLSAVDEYRGVAGYVLHYTEHWDGSGWPAGLARRDIPLISRIIAAVDRYSTLGKDIPEGQKFWYDPEIMEALGRFYPIR